MTTTKRVINENKNIFNFNIYSMWFNYNLSKAKNEQIKPQRIIEEHQVTPVEPLNIAVPKSLKINFKNGTNYCKTQNIAQNGAFENCVLNYIYERNKKDHETILKINTYCSRTTTNECDRRNCVEEYME